MLVEFYDRISHSMKTITIRDIIGNGSNSNVYDVSSDDLPKASVAKCSKNHSNYVSFNLQYNASLKVINSITDLCVIIPDIYMYGYSQNLGEILVMEKVENICQLDLIINNSIGEGLLIIRTVATFIAHLHNVGISGYDIEFYWKLDSRQLVVLDIGPLDTFNCSSKAMICSHWHQENENNLKNISVTIAHNRLYGICGVSGSGKSSLACDVIARYALNNFSLSMSTRLKNKLFNNNYPNVKKNIRVASCNINRYKEHK